MKDSLELSSKEEFEDYESRWKKERFITEFFSDELKFSEVLNYTRYLNRRKIKEKKRFAKVDICCMFTSKE